MRFHLAALYFNRIVHFVVDLPRNALVSSVLTDTHVTDCVNPAFFSTVPIATYRTFDVHFLLIHLRGLSQFVLIHRALLNSAITAFFVLIKNELYFYFGRTNKQDLGWQCSVRKRRKRKVQYCKGFGSVVLVSSRDDGCR